MAGPAIDDDRELIGRGVDRTRCRGELSVRQPRLNVSPDEGPDVVLAERRLSRLRPLPLKAGFPPEAEEPGPAAGVDALMAGRSSVVAGSFRNRIQAEVATHLPDALTSPILGRMTRPQG
jgi:hypothetical protein